MSAYLSRQSNIRIPGQSINFEVPLIQFFTSSRNQSPVFGVRMDRIVSNRPVMFPEYSHSSISSALAEQIRLDIRKMKYDLVDLIHVERQCLNSINQLHILAWYVHRTPKKARI